eukprot:NODE_1493_length_1931_cov_42.720686_g1265_i0.p1 GENE.NODE_1493_length_1931_cov_42.720686_g1265_i0~~NODE_1493_length_1931_cov_42.720686_g1265_i0.p1  ORF type:complete len:583 (-),score=122.19 NODE_1493_length_1931_cov_42.720686_g1265_i0:119-1867(-)
MNDGVIVQYYDEYGWAAVANQDFEIGDVLVEEPPLLEVKYTGNNMPTLKLYFAMIKAYFLASAEVKKKVSELYSPTLDEIQKRIETHSDLVRGFKELYDLAQKASDEFIKSLNLNAQYKDILDHIPVIFHFNSFSIRSDSVLALFYRSSKLTHSCFPNSSMHSNQEMERHVAKRHISKGELITTSYWAAYPSWPHSLRQSSLLAHQAFLCKCDRCNGLDYSRSVPCPKCNSSIRDPQTNLLPNAIGVEDLPHVVWTSNQNWTCEECQTSFNDNELYVDMEKEDEFNKLAQHLDEKMGSKSFSMKSETFLIVEKKLSECLLILGRRHWASIKLMEMSANSLIHQNKIEVSTVIHRLQQLWKWHERHPQLGPEELLSTFVGVPLAMIRKGWTLNEGLIQYSRYLLPTALLQYTMEGTCVQHIYEIISTSTVNNSSIPVLVAQYLNQRGNELRREGEYLAAYKWYKQALLLDVDNPFLLANRAASLIGLSQYKEAEMDARRSVKINSKFRRGYYLLSCALAAQNRSKEAACAWAVRNAIPEDESDEENPTNTTTTCLTESSSSPKIAVGNVKNKSHHKRKGKKNK